MVCIKVYNIAHVKTYIRKESLYHDIIKVYVAYAMKCLHNIYNADT